MPGLHYIPTILPTQTENRFYEFPTPSSLTGVTTNGGINGTNGTLTRLNDFSINNPIQREQILQRSNRTLSNFTYNMYSVYQKFGRDSINNIKKKEYY